MGFFDALMSGLLAPRGCGLYLEPMRRKCGLYLELSGMKFGFHLNHKGMGAIKTSGG